MVVAVVIFFSLHRYVYAAYQLQQQSECRDGNDLLPLMAATGASSTTA